MRHPRITYTPSSDVTPSQVLGAIYRRAIDRYRETQAAEDTDNANKDDAKVVAQEGRQTSNDTS